VDFVPYTAFHVIGMLELLMFGALAFTLLVLSGYYPAEMRAVNLDTDWFLRLPGRRFILFCEKPLQRFFKSTEQVLLGVVGALKASPLWAVDNEKKNDYIFHKWLAAFPEFIYTRGRHLKTEIKVLSYNLTYILLFFVVLLWIMIFLTG
jgi:hypothetical protein